MIEVLTIGLAGLIDSDEVLVAAALVRTFSVVADVGTHSKLLTLVFICKIHLVLSLQEHILATTSNVHHVARAKNNNNNCTFTSVASIRLEAGFAGTERVRAVHHTMSFISVSAHCSVTATVVQHRVCKQDKKKIDLN